MLRQLALATLLLTAPVAEADALKNTEIKAVVDDALESFMTPGMAVGIVKDGKVVHLAGYGIKDMNSREAVTPDTLFRIASTTKLSHLRRSPSLWMKAKSPGTTR